MAGLREGNRRRVGDRFQGTKGVWIPSDKGRIVARDLLVHVVQICLGFGFV